MGEHFDRRRGGAMPSLYGIGLYTPSEAERLIKVSASKISRWLKGHTINRRVYTALWQPEIDLGDGKVYLSFRDLIEVRVAAAFINAGVSAQRVRVAIDLAREVLGVDRPLSTDNFQTDGRDIFLRVLKQNRNGEEVEQLLNTFRRQYAFAEIIKPSLSGVEFNDKGIPKSWYPLGKRSQIIVDPCRSFGQPIDEISSVPTAVLAAAGVSQGIESTSKAFRVTRDSVRRAIAFENDFRMKSAA